MYLCTVIKDIPTCSTSKYREEGYSMFSIFANLIINMIVCCLTVLFIPATNLDYTRTIFDDQKSDLVMAIFVNEWEIYAILSMTFNNMIQIF
jgi:hypothetical protein